MKKILLALFCLFAVVGAGGRVSAQGVNDFTIHSFDAQYRLTRDDQQGKLYIKEKIELTFSGNNRGIERAVPKVYNKSGTNPKVVSAKRDGKTEKHTTYTSNNNLVIRIGDPDVYITGRHSYEIEYTVENVIYFGKDYDELYWNINGNYWSQPFEKVSVSVLPEQGLVFKDTPPPTCYTGRNNSKEAACQFSPPEGGFGADLRAETTRVLQPGETLTIALAIPKDYFSPPTWLDKNGKYLAGGLLSLLPLAVVRNAYKKWKVHGKDHPAHKVIAPAFGPPKKLTVMESGLVYKDNLEARHISAALIDLAVKGYIRIKETDERSFLKKKTKISLELLKDTSKLSKAEAEVVKALFGGSTVGSSINLEDRKNKLHAKLTVIGKIVSSAAKDKGMYETAPYTNAGMFTKHFVALGAISGIGFLVPSVASRLAALISVLGLIFVIFLTSSITKRSHLGTELKRDLEGLKLYLGMAEKDRLKMLQSVKAPLAINAAEPVRDVKLFEKLLPYAIIFGVEKTWAKAFGDLYTAPPDWYQGNWTAFNAGVLASHIDSSVSAVNSSFTAPTSSGGSGFSGGGGAGGGGGGGGGGGW